MAHERGGVSQRAAGFVCDGGRGGPVEQSEHVDGGHVRKAARTAAACVRTSLANVSTLPAHEGMRTAERGELSCVLDERAVAAIG